MTTDTPSAPAGDDLHGQMDDAHRILHLSEGIAWLRAELAEVKKQRDASDAVIAGDHYGIDFEHAKAEALARHALRGGGEQEKEG